MIRNVMTVSIAGSLVKAWIVGPLKHDQELAFWVQERGALPRGRPTPGGEDWLANPVLPEDILREAVSPLCSATLLLEMAKQTAQ